ncbi:DUF1616 domain-containing protein [Natrarchaeobius chitinivorans]|uniref:DUF1616 domain-containing protein n=1 Tax=Natrarchaeobius chitinivorans TaxID=1679083 RepID=A0A3N6M1F9_NATCH|nr:DUF1616 domain-containing protein [Natrarchaeobius chitinivorans]RQG97158.1 DUF1616 domain-containing protein [Natrarchaeobius chitinivorans]
MSFRTRTRTRLGYLLSYPFDLAVVSIVTVLAYVVVTTLPEGSLPGLFLTVPFALFLPGYALVSVLFPATERTARETARSEMETRPGGIDVAERLGLSFALSIVIVPLVVLSLSVTEWGLGTQSIAAGLGLIIVALAQLGAIRRLRTPESERFTVSPVATIVGLQREDGALATASSTLLVVAIGTAIAALLVAFLLPASAGGFTELALYSENEDGDLVAGDIPNEVGPGESVPVTISLENQEGERMEYTVVVQQQVLEDDVVVDRTDLQEIEADVSDGGTVTSDQQITPTTGPGETVRISVLLYEGDAPVSPTNENADEDVYFWVTTTADETPEEG